MWQLAGRKVNTVSRNSGGSSFIHKLSRNLGRDSMYLGTAIILEKMMLIDNFVL